MSAQPVDVLAVREKIMHAAALLSQKGEPRASNALIETAAAVAELVRLTERVLYVQSLTGNAKAQAWDKLDRDLRAALARVQGGAA